MYDKRRLKLAVFALLLGALTAGCGPKRVFAPTPEGEYEHANDLFQRKQYTKSIDAFKQLIYKYPGSDLVEHARYYLADSYFQNRDYMLAADEFERLNREFPQGRFADVALFKAALSYEEMSRRYERDQNETTKALETMETLLSKYPNTEYVDTIRVHRQLLRDRLAKKDYAAAIFYLEEHMYDSAIIYLKGLLETYPTSSSVPGALFNLYLSSRKMGYPDDANDARDRLLKEFPDNEFSRRLQASEADSSGAAMIKAIAPGDSVVNGSNN